MERLREGICEGMTDEVGMMLLNPKTIVRDGVSDK